MKNQYKLAIIMTVTTVLKHNHISPILFFFMVIKFNCFNFLYKFALEISLYECR